MSKATFVTPSWLPLDSEMSKRIAAFDWSATPLGAIETWPEGLSTSVSLMLAMPGPATILWGASHIQIYNDAYVPIAKTRHPTLLGLPVAKGWPDAYEEVILPLIEAAEAGHSTALMNYPVDLCEPDDAEERRVFHTAWSPIRDRTGAVAGMLQTLVEVTGRQRAEATMRASEARYRAFVTASSEVVYRMSPDWSEMRYLKGADVLDNTFEPSRDWLERYILVEEQPRVQAAIDQAIRTRSIFELEHRVFQADGSPGWVHSRAVPVFDETGEITEWLGTANDVTYRREAARAQAEVQQALRESEELRRIAIEGGGMGTWRWDLREGHIWGDGVFLDLWGFPPSDQPGRLEDFTPRMSAHGQAEMGEMVTRAVAAGETFDGQLRVAAGPTEGRWIRWRGRAEQERPWILNGVSFDVTEQRLAEERLRASEARLAAVFESLPVGAAVVGADGTFVLGNAEIRHFIPRGIMPSLDPDSVWRWRCWLADGRLAEPEDFPGARALRGERVVPGIEMLYVGDEGEETWTSVSAAPIRDEAGQVREQVTVVTDIDATKRNAEALEDSEARFRTLAEGIPQLVWRSYDAGRWTWASPQWCDYTGQSPAASLGLGWLQVVHPEDHAAAREAWSRTRETGKLDVEYRVWRASDSSWRWHATRSLPVHAATVPEVPTNRTTEWLGTTTDIDELKRLQGQQAVLVSELQHRTRNLLVQSVGRRSFGKSTSRDTYEARLRTLGRVQGFLSKSTDFAVPLGDLVQAELEAAGHEDMDRVDVSGPPVELSGESVQVVALVVHELATNAVKYGALAQPDGHLSITWRLEGHGEAQRLAVEWIESGVHMPSEPPAHRGYGTELITRALPMEKAETTLEFGPDGVQCRILLATTAIRSELKERK